MAFDRGLIGLDEPVIGSVPASLFAAEHNRPVTWDHLLRQTSDWRGEPFGKPDRVYRYEGSWATVEGQRKQSPSGGGHWGGGVWITAGARPASASKEGLERNETLEPVGGVYAPRLGVEAVRGAGNGSHPGWYTKVDSRGDPSAEGPACTVSPPLWRGQVSP